MNVNTTKKVYNWLSTFYLFFELFYTFRAEDINAEETTSLEEPLSKGKILKSEKLFSVNTVKKYNSIEDTLKKKAPGNVIFLELNRFDFLNAISLKKLGTALTVGQMVLLKTNKNRYWALRNRNCD